MSPFRMFFIAALTTGMVGSEFVAMAEPIIEKGDRAEVNWGALEVRYFGDAAPEPDETDSFKGTERRAWQDGVAAIDETLQMLSKGRIGMHVSAPRGAASIGGSRATSRFTTYFGDGKVRVYLQSPLQQVVTAALGEVSFRRGTVGGSEGEATEFSGNVSASPTGAHTGVIIELEQQMAPRAVYKLMDQAGEKLFGLEDMSEEGFRKSLMGRWFRRVAASERTAHVGANPLIIKGKPEEPMNRIIIDRAAWTAGGPELASMIAAGRVIVSTP